MSTMLVLMGLLLLSYLGGWLARGRKSLAAGLPSSSEYLLIGVLAGPLVFNGVTHTALEAFDPIAYVAIGWLALASGLGYGHVGARRVTFPRIALGVSLTLACGLIVALAVVLALPSIAMLSPRDRLLLAGGMGCVCAESTRHAVVWTIRRHGAKGPMTDLLRDLGHSDEIVPILATALLFTLHPPAHVSIHIPQLGWAAITVVMGLLLGALTAILLARDLRVAESWGTLLGTSLMTIGLAARLDLAAVTAMFALGASIAWLSRHGSDVGALVQTTERAVTLPALVLAGARINPASIGRLWVVIPIAIVVRLLVKWVAGGALQTRHPARGGGHLVGLGLSSSGGMSVLIGLAMALQFPGPIGDTVLATAIAATLVGEPIGPWVQVHLLRRAGEVPMTAPSSDESIEEPSEGEIDGEDEEHGHTEVDATTAATASTSSTPLAST